MTPIQKLNYDFQLASTEAEAFLAWGRHREELKDSALIMSLPCHGQNGIRMPKVFGNNARLISTFAHEDLFFLNEHIYSEMSQGRDCSFPVAYTISFDTNAASYLRGLFEDRNTSVHQDIHKLLLHFYPHKLNWQIFPYLIENADSILAGRDDRVIFETVLAAEKLEDIDWEYLRFNGRLRLRERANDSLERASRRLSDVARHFSSGAHVSVLERWEALYVAVLFMTIEQLQKPGVERAAKKLKALIEFMDKELHALLLEFLFIAWDWFNGGKRSGIFNRLQKNAPGLLDKVRNISWDILHLTQIRQKATFVERKQSFLVPFFLTFDQDLADLIGLCGIKSCLISGSFEYPMCFTNRDADAVFGFALANDPNFIEKYLSVDANRRRGAWLETHGRPNLSAVRRDLEVKLLNCGR